jgi:hypothetical protein
MTSCHGHRQHDSTTTSRHNQHHQHDSTTTLHHGRCHIGRTIVSKTQQRHRQCHHHQDSIVTQCYHKHDSAATSHYVQRRFSSTMTYIASAVPSLEGLCSDIMPWQCRLGSTITSKTWQQHHALVNFTSTMPLFATLDNAIASMTQQCHDRSCLGSAIHRKIQQ